MHNLPAIPDAVLPFLPWIPLVAEGAAALLGLWVLWRLYRWGWPKVTAAPFENVLTVVAAAIATGVSAQGMWRFSGDVLGLDGPLRLLLFAFIEVAIITSAVRARRNMRENFSAGIDGIAVWALTVLTAVLSSMDARSLPEAVFRLASPLVAAWLWERGMAIERHRIRGTGRINWRLTPERLLVRVGLAEARDRTASEVDAHRRLTRVALAAKRAKALREADASERKIRAALAKLDKAMDQAVEHTGLPRDPAMQAAMLDQITSLYGGAKLLELHDSPPWEQLDHPAITGTARHSEALELAAALRDHTDALMSHGDRELSAMVVSLAEYIRRRDGLEPVTSAVASRAADVTNGGWAYGLPDVADERPFLDLDSLSEPVTTEVPDSDLVDDSGDDSGATRDKPSEQDNQAAEEWIRRRCRGQNGVGRKPSQADVNSRFGFSAGWARKRIMLVQSRMLAQGYEFEPDGTVLSPRRTLTESDTVARSEVSA